MPSTATSHDVRNAYKTLLNLLDIHHAKYSYVDRRSEMQTFHTDGRLTRTVLLKQLEHRMGDNGYITDVLWFPAPGIKFRIKLEPDDSIVLSWGELGQKVGIDGTKFKLVESKDIRHVERAFADESELVHYVLSVATRWRQVNGIH